METDYSHDSINLEKKNKPGNNRKIVRFALARKTPLLKCPKFTSLTQRSKIPLILNQLGLVDGEWVTFVQNNAELNALPNVDLDEPYFASGYFNTVKQLVEKLTTKINDALLPVNGNHPTYNLIQRGIYETKRMFNDEGSDIRDNTHENSLVSRGGLSDTSTTGNGNPAKTKSASTGLTPIVHDFFENLSNN